MKGIAHPVVQEIWTDKFIFDVDLKLDLSEIEDLSIKQYLYSNAYNYAVYTGYLRLCTELADAIPLFDQATEMYYNVVLLFSDIDDDQPEHVRFVGEEP